MWSGFHLDELEGDLETKWGINGKYIYGQVGDNIHTWLASSSFLKCQYLGAFRSLFLSIRLNNNNNKNENDFL